MKAGAPKQLPAVGGWETTVTPQAAPLLTNNMPALMQQSPQQAYTGALVSNLLMDAGKMSGHQIDDRQAKSGLRKAKEKYMASEREKDPNEWVTSVDVMKVG